MTKSHDKKDDKKYTGYWNGDDHPSKHVDESWLGIDRTIVIAFLKFSNQHHPGRGSASCHICGDEVSSVLHSDGVWVWPIWLVHYVEEHHVKPDQELVEYVKTKVLEKVIGDQIIKKGDPVSNLKIRLIKSISSDNDGDSPEAFDDKDKKYAAVYYKLKKLSSVNDMIVASHLHEISKRGCDIVSYINEEFDVDILRMILYMAVGNVSGDSYKWSKYTELISPIINGKLVEAERSGEEPDA